MTFTEAAIEVLRREGKPLHFKKIAEIAIRESLLEHVGKIPEEVMGGQLATHCRLPHADRKVVAVQSGTFALVEWGLDEDPNGLDGIVEPPPDVDVLYRPRERHPVPSRDMARSTGRGEARARRREEGEERRGRRYPPPAEVAYEILAGADRPLSLTDIAAQGAERFLMPDAFVRDTSALAAALAEDNRRRESAGRKPLFAVEGEAVTLAAQPEPGERAAAPITVPRPAASSADLRRSGLLALRRRIRECDPPTVEHVVARLLEAMGIRELKVAKRGRDHVVYTGRRRLGLGDVRHCMRILRSGAEASRRDVSEVRRDVGHYGAQIGVLLSPGDAARDARSEAVAAGQIPVLLVCGDALAEALTEHSVGCRPVVVPEVDESYFKAAADTAQQEEAARRARREERERREARETDRREPREAREPRERAERGEPESAAAPAEGEAAAPADAAEGAAPAEQVAANATAAAVSRALREPGADLEDEAGEGEGDDDDGDEAEGGEPAAAAGTGAEGERPEGERGEGRRRRRRRRRRGGRGRTREGQAAGAGPAEGAAAATSGSEGGGSGAAPGGAPEAGPAPTAAPPQASGATGGGDG